MLIKNQNKKKNNKSITVDFVRYIKSRVKLIGFFVNNKEKL